MFPEPVPERPSQVRLAAQGVLEQFLGLDEQVLVDGAGQIGVPGNSSTIASRPREASQRAAIWAPTKRTSSRLGRAPPVVSNAAAVRRETYGLKNSRSKVRWLSTSQSNGSAWLRPSGASMPQRWTRAP